MTEVVGVATSSGSLRGTSADGVAAFLGVPYATTGGRRFGAPRAFAALSGEIDATRWGPISPQLPFLKAFQALTAGHERLSELWQKQEPGLPIVCAHAPSIFENALTAITAHYLSGLATAESHSRQRPAVPFFAIVEDH